MILLNDDNKEIPLCNYKGKLYVSDQNMFKQTKNDTEVFSTLAFVFIICFCIFMLIFSLNFATGGWHLGNILTFVLMFISLFCMYYYGSRWLNTRAVLKTLREQSNPCYVNIENGWKIFNKSLE